MRHLILLLLLVPAQAWAWDWQEFKHTPSDSTNRHVAILWDDFGHGGNVAASAALAAQQAVTLASLERGGWGRYVAQLRRAGVEVHTYTYSQMKADPTKWAAMGTARSSGGGGYAVTVLPGWFMAKQVAGSWQRFAADLMRFSRADQTTTHMIHYGGAPNGLQWTDAWTTTSDSSMCIGGKNSSLSSPIDGSSDILNTQYAVPSTGDSIYLSRVDGVLCTQAWNATGFQTESIFNLLRHYPGVRDSVRADGDTLTVAWRVRKTSTGAYTDWVLTPESTASTATFAPAVLWALTAKWVKLDQIPLAMSIADYAEWGMDPHFGSLRPQLTWNVQNQGQYAWPDPDSVTAKLNRLRTVWGVENIVIGTMPDSAASLWTGYTDYAEHANLPHAEWGLHYHTRDTVSYMGLALGGAVHNAPVVGDTSGAMITRLMVGNRWDPSASIGLKWGVAQKMARQDSALSAQGLKTSKFMLPGNDGLVNPATWKDYTNAARTPAESLFVALANAGKTLIAGSPGTGSAANYPRVSGTQGFRWPLRTDETYTTNDGRKIHFTSYVVISADWGGPLTMLESANAGQQATNRLLGFTSSNYGRNYTNQIHGVTQARQKNIDDGRSRVFGVHIQFIEAPASDQVGDYRAWEVTVFKSLKALEGLAGHKIHKWTTPEVAFASEL